MARDNNYLIQAAQAKARFLTYDQEKLIRKFNLRSDGQYIYVKLLCKQYRISRENGDMEKWEDGWMDGNSYEEVMTLLDLLCDSRDDRHLARRWKSMESFGLMFHQNLLQNEKNPSALAIQEDPEGFAKACLAMGGETLPGADIGYAIELFDGMKVAVQFWFGDDEFYPRLRYLWDENANQYIRYETMYFAVHLLIREIFTMMNKDIES